MTTATALGPAVDIGAPVIDRARRGDQEAFAAVIRLPAEPRSGFTSYCSRKRHLTRTFRDEVLGAALRELEAPEHRPEFYPELNRLLAREQAARRRERRRGPRVRWAPRVALGAALVTETFRGEFRRQIRIEEPALDPHSTATAPRSRSRRMPRRTSSSMDSDGSSSAKLSPP